MKLKTAFGLFVYSFALFAASSMPVMANESAFDSSSPEVIERSAKVVKTCKLSINASKKLVEGDEFARSWKTSTGIVLVFSGARNSVNAFIVPKDCKDKVRVRNGFVFLPF